MELSWDECTPQSAFADVGGRALRAPCGADMGWGGIGLRFDDPHPADPLFEVQRADSYSFPCDNTSRSWPDCNSVDVFAKPDAAQRISFG